MQDEMRHKETNPFSGHLALIVQVHCALECGEITPNEERVITANTARPAL